MKKQLKFIRYRRRRIGKTNYKKRLLLLKSGKPRLVIRKTNRFITAQIIEFDPAGDKIITGVSSRQLKKIGWQFSTQNISASYLTGVLLYKKLKEKRFDLKKEIIPDVGLHTPVINSKIYALIKGLKDCGLNVLSSDEIFPDEDRIRGKHITAYCKINKSKIQFSTYKNIENYEKNFSEILNKLKV